MQRNFHKYKEIPNKALTSPPDPKAFTSIFHFSTALLYFLIMNRELLKHIKEVSFKTHLFEKWMQNPMELNPATVHQISSCKCATFFMKAGASDHILPLSSLCVVAYFLNKDLKSPPSQNWQPELCHLSKCKDHMIHLFSATMQGKHFPKRNVGWPRTYIIIQILKCFRCFKVLLDLILAI